MSYIITQTADELPAPCYLIAYGPDGTRWTDVRKSARQYETTEAAESVLEKIKQLHGDETATIEIEPYEKAVAVVSQSKEDWKKWKIKEIKGTVFVYGYALCILESEARYGYMHVSNPEKIIELEGNVQEQLAWFFAMLNNVAWEGAKKKFNVSE